MYDHNWIGGVPTITIENSKNFDDGKVTNIRMSINFAGVDPATIRRI